MEGQGLGFFFFFGEGFDTVDSCLVVISSWNLLLCFISQIAAEIISQEAHK